MMISTIVSVLLLSGLLTMITTLVAGRRREIAAILADGVAMQRDRDQLLLPLRFAA